MVFVSFHYRNEGSFSALVASFGAILVAIKFKLDQATYHKSLFEERYAIFLKIDEILSASFQVKYKNGNEIDGRNLSKELDSIYRKSFFLFGTETYRFIANFRESVILYSYCQNKELNNNAATDELKNAETFLISLLDGQNLSKKFKELKIDTY